MPKRLTLSDIRAANTAAGFYFFSRDTMRAFGDTMRSFAVRRRDGMILIERVRPMRDRDGRSMGGVGKLYRFDPATGGVNSYDGESAA